MPIKYDLIVIGGGFFGTSIALFKANQGLSVLLLEREKDILSRASQFNQARIHGGYHYPRSILTALRSRVNFSRFIDSYPGAVERDFRQYFAIARDFSKVNAYQFETFCRRIDAPLKQVNSEIRNLFDQRYIEGVFEVEEYAFNVKVLTRILHKELAGLVAVNVGCEVEKVRKEREKIEVLTSQGSFFSTQVYNCTYSGINQINRRSGLPSIPLKYELAELCLFSPPPELNKVGVTVMCGPFFSIMPFPAIKGAYSLSHVRYTPHLSWEDSQIQIPFSFDLKENLPESAFRKMLADAQRYLPAIRHAKYIRSIWEIKTMLPQSEMDDSRPILIRSFDELPGYIVIMGGKIDNVFDALQELKEKEYDSTSYTA